MSYQQQFEDIIKAIESLKIFPDTIKEFTDLLKQRYRRKHSTKDLVWIEELCGVYYDKCHNYVKFIKRVIATQFLAKCLSVEDDSGRRAMIVELRANIEASNRQLDRFLGKNDKKEVLEKVDGVLTEMEAMQAKKEKKDKYYYKFSEFLKGKLIAQVGEVFAKVISPLWDLVYSNAVLAVEDDYDHKSLQQAVSTIAKYVPEMEASLEKNRRALQGINAVLDVLEKESEAELKLAVQRLYPMQNRAEDTCNDILKLLNNLKAE